MLPRLSAIAMFAIVVFFSAKGANAHPLGNFTINHMTRLSIERDTIRVHYVLDMAEIPTFQALGAQNASQPQAQRVDTYAKSLAPMLLSEMQLDFDGTRAALVLDGTRATTRPGAGQLPTLYVVLDAHSAMPSAHASIAFHDKTFADRLGWHDIVVAPASEPTRELTAYPSALIGSPRATTAVDISRDPLGHVVVHATTASQASTSGVPAPSQLRSNQLSDMLARGTSDWGFVALTFLVAIVLGALHALEPGHGKTLLAISLVGARATVKQATILATALTVAHTIGVLALGVAINLFKGYFVPETIYPWITLISGIVIAVIGARAVQRQMRMRNASAVLAHGHAFEAPHTHDRAGGQDHAHDHGHDHADLDDFAHARAHAIPGNAPLTFGGTVWAAMSGGVAPCPAALVVLLAAVALNQVAYGIFVIIAFSFGLAATLTGLGIAVVRGATWLQGRPQFERFVTIGPLVSAIVIATIGAIMVGQGFAQKGINFSPLLVSAIVALTIAAFAFLRSPVRHRAEAT